MVYNSVPLMTSASSAVQNANRNCSIGPFSCKAPVIEKLNFFLSEVPIA